MMRNFLTESNHIEGIRRGPTDEECAAFAKFMALPAVTVADLDELQAVFAPHKPLRRLVGMDVQVGSYIAPRGGPAIEQRLINLLEKMYSPWKTHVDFELLHPYMDGNGRTGRMLWAWHMRAFGGGDPFSLSFLHRFYYQTLQVAG